MRLSRQRSRARRRCRSTVRDRLTGGAVDFKAGGGVHARDDDRPGDALGSLTELCTHWTGEPARRQLAVTFNQANHLLGLADPTSQGVWIAGTVDLGTDTQPVDAGRAAHAVARFLSEHEALRARFRFDPQTCMPYADVFGPDQVQVTVESRGDVGSDDLAILLGERCRSGDVPGVLFGLLDATLVVGFDHAHCDALTVDLALRRVRELYLDPDTQRSPGQRFFDRSELDGILSEKLAAAAASIPDYPPGEGSSPPTGTPSPPSRCRSARFRQAAPRNARGWWSFSMTTPRRHWAGARSPRSSRSSPHQSPNRVGRKHSTVIPVHTRGRSSSPWHRTAGWLVTNAPVRVRAGDVGGAERALKSALGLASVPLDHVLRRCQPAMTTADIFMVSYLDYRRLGDPLPGARHISNSTTTDSLQMWFSATTTASTCASAIPTPPPPTPPSTPWSVHSPNACAATPTPQPDSKPVGSLISPDPSRRGRLAGSRDSPQGSR